MKPVIERLSRGGGVWIFVEVSLPNSCTKAPIVDLSSSIDRKFAEVSEKHFFEILFLVFVDSGTKNEKKVDAGNRVRFGISKFSTFFENADVDFETSQF